MFGITGHMCIWFPYSTQVPEDVYVQEDGETPYVTEDSTTPPDFYVPET
jgi:hypothetical protein